MVDHSSTVRGARSARAVVLIILWLQVATANMAACTLDVQRGHASGSSHALPSHHLGMMSHAVTAAADCGDPQLLLLDYIAPLAARLPEVMAVGVRQIAFAPVGRVSPTLQIDPPPPRV